MKAQQERTKVAVSRNEKITYIERRILFGLVRWWKKVSTESFADDLMIETDFTIRDIYVNGKKI